MEEYANWQATNDSFFSNLFGYSDYVVAEKLEQGSGTTSPLQTDSVEVHYAGRLLPSLSYPQGYQFDSSFSGTFDPGLDTPAKFWAGGLVKGFWCTCIVATAGASIFLISWPTEARQEQACRPIAR